MYDEMETTALKRAESSTPTKVPALTAELERQQNTINRLESAISTLYVKLGPLMTPSPEENLKESANVEPVNVSGVIASSNTRIGKAANIVEEICSRLEI